MAKFALSGIKISGIQCAVPKHQLKTTSFYSVFDQNAVDSFMKMTGVINTHRSVEEQTASDLCFVAARELIQNKKLNLDEIGALVFISQTPDYVLPATAFVLHHRLGLSKNCMVFDVNLGCSGYVYGLNIVGSMMKTANIQKAIVLFGDTSTKTTAPEDRSAIMLFGDSGTATLLEKDDSSSLKGELMSDGDGYKAIILYAGAYRNRFGSHERVEWADGIKRSDYDGYMNGTDVFSFSVTKVPRLIKTYLMDEGKTPDDYDALILHQGNLYMLEQIAKKTKFDMAKVPLSLSKYGNTSGGSIPITLCDAYGDKPYGSLRVLMCGFGIGLSWGVAEADINVEDIYPIIETDEYYAEGGISHG